MVEGEVALGPAILAGELVAEEQVEAREGRELRRPDILFERDDRRKLQPRAGTSDLAFVERHDIDPVEEQRLDRRLPRPDAEWIIAQRRVIGVEDKRGATVRMADQIGMVHALPHPFRLPHSLAGNGDVHMTAYAATRGQGPV